MPVKGTVPRAIIEAHLKPTCEGCGSTDRLGLHHNDEDRSNNAPDNLRTFCPSCHTKWHWEHGKSHGSKQRAEREPVPAVISESLRHLVRPLAGLLPDPRNARTHGPRNIDAIKASLTAFGQVEPLVLNRRTGQLVGGHGRVEAMQAIGWTEAAVTEVDLDPIQATALGLALNRSAELAEWDEAMLAELLQEIDRAPEVELELVGFTDAELVDLIGQQPADPATDDVPPPPVVATTQPGDLILLGWHRLVCGSASVESDFERATNGQRPDLCLTDPPYGVGLTYDGYEDSEAALTKLIGEWLPIARRLCDVTVFTSGVERAWLYPRPDWAMCWFYGGGQLRSQWGFNCWQPILCYGSCPSLSSGSGCRPDAVDLNVPANLPGIDHPCPKPVALWSWLFDRLIFKPNALVADVFGGSGTTLIVAEQMGHSAALIEQSPAYCDVIVSRWEAHTGLVAERCRQ